MRCIEFWNIVLKYGGEVVSRRCAHKQNYQANGGLRLPLETSAFLAMMIWKTYCNIQHPTISFQSMKHFLRICSASFDNIWGISYDFENWLGMYLFRNIWGTFLLWWKACIWARLIFSLLIIRLDIVSLRYGHYVHLLLTRYLQIIFPFSPPDWYKKKASVCTYVEHSVWSPGLSWGLCSPDNWVSNEWFQIKVSVWKKYEYKVKETNTNLNKTQWASVPLV